MRRIAVVTCALAALVGGASADARSRPVVTGPGAKLVDCDVSGADRSATFYGRMETVPEATRMAIRFTLFERLGKGQDWEKMDVPTLRDWHRSVPGVKTFGYKQTVDHLRTGGAYKARISYRWSDATGATVQSETRETPVCRGPLPNLLVSDFVIRRGPTADTRTYRVTLENNGKAVADAINVLLTVDKAVLDATRVKALAPGDSHTVSFTGPACTHAARVRLDPDNVIGELLEADNTQVFTCSE